MGMPTYICQSLNIFQKYFDTIHQVPKIFEPSTLTILIIVYFLKIFKG